MSDLARVSRVGLEVLVFDPEPGVRASRVAVELLVVQAVGGETESWGFVPI